MGSEMVGINAPHWLYHPGYSHDWKRCSLYSMAQWINGLAFKSIQFSPTGMPVIKIAEIKGGISGQTKFTKQTFDDAVRIRRGDLLFSWSGQPETSIDVFWWRGPEGWLNQHVFKVTPIEGIDPTFFFYLLRYLKPNFVGIARNKQTTGLGHVTKRDLENLEGAYPTISEQRAIAHILGTLDDKIELNSQMSQTLESMARALFKSWFVDFDPVRDKAVGRDPGLPSHIADLFPDRLVDSELGEIPEGWEVKQVSDVLTLMYGKSLPAVERCVGDVPVYGSGGIVGLHNEALVDHPTIIVGRKGTVGSLYWEGRPCYPIDTVFFVRPIAPIEYCYFLLETFPLRDMNTDAAVPGLNRENVYRLDFASPSEELVKIFAGIMAKVHERVAIISRNSESLNTVRDTLLPKLISGQICLKDIDRVAEVA